MAREGFIFKEMVKRETIVNFEQEYEILDKIGTGTYAEVFKGRWKLNG